MIYVISDIHGEYRQFMELLKKINFSEEDTLYVLGDVLDRGLHPVKVLQFMMKQPNIIPIVGNHELMGAICLRFLLEEVNDETVNEMDDTILGELMDWQANGSSTTLEEFYRLDRAERENVIEYIEDFKTFETVSVNGQFYILVHAGLGNFAPNRALDDYSIDELVWERPDYSKEYFKNIQVVTGHTPTQGIEGNPRPGFIYRANNHIAIDCGACFPGGRLAAICLDTGEEFYTSTKISRAERMRMQEELRRKEKKEVRRQEQKKQAKKTARKRAKRKARKRSR